MKVFYHNDLDGKCAAHVINRYHMTVPSQFMYPMQYGMEFPLGEIEPSEEVWIVDYSIEPEEMAALLVKTEAVNWIDHHQSAMDKYDGFYWVSRDQAERNVLDIRGVRKVGVAGCVLTYEYVQAARPEISMIHPWHVTLIGDRDVFAFEYGDKTKNFCLGIESFDTFPRAPIWDRLSGLYDKISVEEVAAMGEPIKRYTDIQAHEFIKEHGFHTEFEGHKCFAVCGRFWAQAIAKAAPDAEILIAFRYLNGSWTISLYSGTVEVNKIAERFVHKGKRGGGHKGAAGFQWSYPPFLGRPKPDGDGASFYENVG